MSESIDDQTKSMQLLIQQRSKVKHTKLAWDAMHELKEEMKCTLNMNRLLADRET